MISGYGNAQKKPGYIYFNKNVLCLSQFSKFQRSDFYRALLMYCINVKDLEFPKFWGTYQNDTLIISLRFSFELEENVILKWKTFSNKSLGNFLFLNLQLGLLRGPYCLFLILVCSVANLNSGSSRIRSFWVTRTRIRILSLQTDLCKSTFLATKYCPKYSLSKNIILSLILSFTTCSNQVRKLHTH